MDWESSSELVCVPSEGFEPILIIANAIPIKTGTGVKYIYIFVVLTLFHCHIIKFTAHKLNAEIISLPSISSGVYSESQS